ncbi:MAG TPA: Hsp70 family protein [Anaerolineae bacterium]|nr:Hsp70 family protein [Anaerolineae bacterium]
MSSYINYGIDLGTTNSAIARWEGSEARVFQNNDQMNVTPSAVRVLKSGRILVGRRAYNGASEDPDNVALEFKRWMGQRGNKSFPAAGRIMSAEELSAEVLKSLLDDARRQTGDQITSAVVTVPADFAVLQCEATARAAKLAGLAEAPLLQEPISAAIAYGAKPGMRDQRWLVFDLGGGTLDIAVISTRDGRLNVMEQRGNRRLGGKDMDRAIVHAFFLPALANSFALPDPEEDAAAYGRLERVLCVNAAEAKIDLSTADEVVVSLVDIGDDQDGNPIEMELSLTRAELEREVEPLVAKCLDLVKEALDGARVAGADIDRVLLVGGPTQMPIVRGALGSVLGAAVDHSVDPMTVVARGAAIYASGVEAHAAPGPAVSRRSGAVLQLAFDPVSSSLTPSVSGRVVQTSAEGGIEIKLDAEGGYWTSGWQKVEDGFFDIQLMLQEGQATRFWIYARDSSGRLIDVEPAEFGIRHGLEVSSPPLPHTICVEVVGSDGRPELRAVFPRGTPLPAESTDRYRAAHAVRPSDPDSALAIKLWEGEELADPEANEWIGRMLISPGDIGRPIPEGSEVEMSIHIDASRLITVEAFIPHLNEHFRERVYLAEREEQDYTELVASLPEQLESHLTRIDEAHARALETDDEASIEEAERLRTDLENLDMEAGTVSVASSSDDHDRLARLVDASRQIRSRLAKLERKAGVDPHGSVSSEDTESAVEAAQEVVEAYGSPSEHRELEVVRREIDRAVTKDDQRRLRRSVKDMDALRWRVLFQQDWFWAEVFRSMQQPGRRFRNESEAKRWLRHGEDAIRRSDPDELRRAVRQLWELQPRDEAKEDQERAMRSGLRTY